MKKSGGGGRGAGWKTQILMNLKATNCCEVPPIDVDIFSFRPMQIAKTSDQFENSVFVIVGN